MSRKRKRPVPVTERKRDDLTVMHLDPVQATRLKKPYIDGFVCRGGVHGKTGYDRIASKRDFRRLIDDE